MVKYLLTDDRRNLRDLHAKVKCVGVSKRMCEEAGRTSEYIFRKETRPRGTCCGPTAKEREYRARQVPGNELVCRGGLVSGGGGRRTATDGQKATNLASEVVSVQSRWLSAGYVIERQC